MISHVQHAVLLPKIAEAAGAGDVEVVAAWLDVPGNSINARGGRSDCTLLMAASGNGHVPLVKLLLDRGASVDIQSNQGLTALMLAAGWCLPTVTFLLLQAGARIDLRDNDGYTALQAAEEAATQPFASAVEKDGASAVAQLLRESSAKQPASIPPREETDMTASVPLPAEIIGVAKAGDVKAVATWLDGGGLIDACETAHDGTLLMIASGHGHVPLVELLLDRGASIDLQSAVGDTALTLSMLWGHHSVANLLLRAGARTDLCDEDGLSALKLAEDAAEDPSGIAVETQAAAEIAQLLRQEACPDAKATATHAATFATEADRAPAAADATTPHQLRAGAAAAAARMGAEVDLVGAAEEGLAEAGGMTEAEGVDAKITGRERGGCEGGKPEGGKPEDSGGINAGSASQGTVNIVACTWHALGWQPSDMSASAPLLRAGVRTNELYTNDADGNTVPHTAKSSTSEASLLILTQRLEDAKVDAAVQRQKETEARETALQRPAKSGDLVQLRQALTNHAQQGSEAARSHAETWHQQQTQTGVAGDSTADGAEASEPIVRQARAKVAMVARMRAEEVRSAEVCAVEAREVEATSRVQHRSATGSKSRSGLFNWKWSFRHRDEPHKTRVQFHVQFLRVRPKVQHS
jgi:ankyrin repeat protein